MHSYSFCVQRSIVVGDRMSFSTIMVYLDLAQSNDSTLRVAVDLAKQFNAKLIGIAAASPKSLYYGQNTFELSLVDLRSVIAKRLMEAEEHFRSLTHEQGLEIEWRSAIQQPEKYVAREARAADLVVIGRNSNDTIPYEFGRLEPGELIIEAGRPVLLLPPVAECLKLKCVMVAWKESREARRAVNDALPLLRKAKDVVVAEVIENEASRTAAHSRVDDVVSWLSGHGVVALGRVFLFPEREEPLKKLEQYGPDLFVAGAYGHARLRELIFGSFTDNFLKHCTQNTFLSH
jgi:nucleotide-binding universal stress UspA family protein